MKVYPDLNDGKKHDGIRVPPPPPITIRTMDSDVKSVQESGGGRPQEEILNAPHPPIVPEVPRMPEENIKIKIPGYVGPEKAVFSPESLPTKEDVGDISETQGGNKKMINLVIVLAIIIAATLIGVGLYFYVYPLLLTETAPEVVTEDGTTPPPPPPPSAHASLVRSEKIEEVSAPSAATPETVSAGEALVKEIVLKDGGSAILLPQYLSSLVKEFSADEIRNTFEADFTAFIYYDETGAWPGYVLKRKKDVVQVVAQGFFRKIESSASLANLFLSNPGARQAEFKNGEYKGVPTRYLVFGEPGATLDYAWVGEYLLITTHFPAMQALIDGRLTR